MRLRHATLAAAMALVFGPLISPPTHAIGVAAANAKSSLYEPLRLDVRLALGTGDEFGANNARIATADQFATAGLAYPSFAGDIHISYERGAKPKEPLLRLRSTRPIYDPVVRLLLELRVGASGTVLVPLTVMLDTPFEAPLLAADLQPSLPGARHESNKARKERLRADKAALKASTLSSDLPASTPTAPRVSPPAAAVVKSLPQVLPPDLRIAPSLKTTKSLMPVLSKSGNLGERVAALEQSQSVLRQDMGEVKQKLQEVGDSLQALKDLAAKASAVPSPVATTPIVSSGMATPAPKPVGPVAAPIPPVVQIPELPVAPPLAPVPIPPAPAPAQVAPAVPASAPAASASASAGSDKPLTSSIEPPFALGQGTEKPVPDVAVKPVAPASTPASVKPRVTPANDSGPMGDHWLLFALGLLGLGGIGAAVLAVRKKARKAQAENIALGEGSTDGGATTEFQSGPDQKNFIESQPTGGLLPRELDPIDQLRNEIFSEDRVGHLIEEIDRASFLDAIDAVQTQPEVLGDYNNRAESLLNDAPMMLNIPLTLPSLDEPEPLLNESVAFVSLHGVTPAPHDAPLLPLTPEFGSVSEPEPLAFTSAFLTDESAVDLGNLHFADDEPLSVDTWNPASSSVPDSVMEVVAIDPVVEEVPLALDFSSLDRASNPPMTDSFTQAMSLARSTQARASGATAAAAAAALKFEVNPFLSDDCPGHLQLNLACLYAQNLDWSMARSTLKEIINDDDMSQSHPEARRLLSLTP